MSIHTSKTYGYICRLATVLDIHIAIDRPCTHIYMIGTALERVRIALQGGWATESRGYPPP